MGRNGVFKISNRPEDFGLLFLWCQPQRGFKTGELAFSDPVAQVGEYAATWPTPLALISPVDNQGKTEFDVCTQLPGNWVTPNSGQFRLLLNCNPLKGFMNGIEGAWFGIPNDLDNGIFLPSSGYREYTEGLYYGGMEVGRYWASSCPRDPYDRYGTSLIFDRTNPIMVYDHYRRNEAYSIRPVKSASYVWDGNPITKDFVELGGVKWAKGNVTGYK